MKKRLCGILLVPQLMGVWLAPAKADSSTTQQQSCASQTDTTPFVASESGCTSTKPAIAVSPCSLDFTSVAVGRSRKLAFTVQNVGAGRLAGVAQASAPFRIVGGSPYDLQKSETQVITVQYVPTAAGMNMSVVRLTGGGAGAASITVAGSATPAPRSAPVRPAAPKNLRLLAGR